MGEGQQAFAGGDLVESPLVGVNFWAWGGEGQPRAPRQPATEKEVLKAHCWQPGDSLVGDPPHEAAAAGVRLVETLGDKN